MPKRSKPQLFSKFTGLDLSDSEYTVLGTRAIVADNVYLDSGRVETRPGRQEISEDQQPVGLPLGLAYYMPPDGNLRSIVLVTSKGIFQRVG